MSTRFFSDAAAPFNFTAKRFQAPVASLEQLPRVDVVLISHDHYDHLDYKTVEFFAQSETDFITPIGVGVHLRRRGIESNRITELDWWQTSERGSVKFTALPAQHFSGRDGINNNESLWASHAIQSTNSNLYFSGDSGYDIHFAKIGAKLGPFDLAFMGNGQYDPAWPQVHMTPEEAVQAHLDLKADALFPVHWGMFELAFHTWYDPIVRLSAAADSNGVTIVTPVIGQTIPVNLPTQSARWWLPLL